MFVDGTNARWRINLRLFGSFSGILRTLVLVIHFGEKNANCLTRLGRSADVHRISDLGRMSNALLAVRRTSFGSVALCGYLYEIITFVSFKQIIFPLLLDLSHSSVARTRCDSTENYLRNEWVDII